jgi:hypothetical protein
LRGEHNKSIRESIGKRGIGFRFAPAGHTLPSGNVANWAHACNAPRRFTRKGKPSSSSKEDSNTTEISDEALLAALG